MRWVAFPLVFFLSTATASADPPRSPAVREADRAAQSATLASQRLLRLLGDARLAGDRRGSGCVDQKLSQVNSFSRMILDHRDRLIAAEGQGNETTAAHLRSVLRNLATRLGELEREGRACIYPGAQEQGTTVITIIDRDVPNEDPSLLTDEDRRRWAVRR